MFGLPELTFQLCSLTFLVLQNVMLYSTLLEMVSGEGCAEAALLEPPATVSQQG